MPWAVMLFQVANKSRNYFLRGSTSIIVMPLEQLN